MMVLIHCFVFLPAGYSQTTLDNSSPMKDGITAVDLYSGQSLISIPLWQGTLKDFIIPVSLNYRTNGILVDQPAGWVGLGWDLDCGGKICRIVRDIPDDYYKLSASMNEIGWLNSHPNACPGISSYPPESGTSAQLTQSFPDDNTSATEYWRSFKLYNLFGSNTSVKSDLEPDIFIFSACGIAGSFIFDATGTPKMIECSNYKIEKSINSSTKEIDNFIITDDDGNKFYFTEKEKVRNSSQILMVENPPMTTQQNRPFQMFVNVTHTIPIYSTGTILHGILRWCKTTGYVSKVIKVPFMSEFARYAAAQKKIKVINGQAYEVPEPEYMEYTTGWCLSKIVTYKQEEVIFEYADERQHLDENFYKLENNRTQNNISNEQVYILSNSNELCEVYQKSKRLKKIYSDNIFKIEFLANTERNDVNTKGIGIIIPPVPPPPPPNLPPYYDCQSNSDISPRRLDYIKVYSLVESSNNPVLKKTFIFSYNYFTSMPISQYLPNGPAIGSDKRLKLISLQEVNETSGDIVQPYSFEYYGSQLPPRFSYAQDYWGYFNGNTTNVTLIPKIFVYPELTEEKRFRLFEIAGAVLNGKTEFILPGSDRNPDPVQGCPNMALGSIKTIFFPSGGHETYEYETNSFIDVADFNNGEIYSQTEQGAGMRLKKRIISEGNSGASYSENYFYEPAEPISVPIYGFFDRPIWLCNGQQLNQEYFNNYFLRSNIDFSDHSDGIIGYPHVSVVKKDNNSNSHYGKSEYTFSHDGTLYGTSSPDGLYSKTPVNFCRSYYDLIAGGYVQEDLSFGSGNYPFTSNVNYAWARGLLMEVIHKNEQNQIVDKTILNDYSTLFKNGNGPVAVYGITAGTLSYNNYNSACHSSCTQCPLYEQLNVYGKYKILTGIAKSPDISTHKLFDINGIEGGITTTDYDYNNDGRMTKITLTQPGGKKLITRFNYIKDVLAGEYLPGYPMDEETASFFSLQTSNNIKTPVEIINLVRDPEDQYEQVTGGTLVTYKIISNSNHSKILALPQKTYKLDLNVPVEYNNPNNPNSFAFSKVMFSSNSYIFNKNRNYRLVSVIDHYDDHWNPVQNHDDHNIYVSTLWGYKGSRIISEVINSSYDESGYTGFENEELAGWSSNGTIITGTGSYAGNAMLSLLNTGTAPFGNSGEGPTKIFPIYYQMPVEGYEASVWVKGPQEAYLHIEINQDWSTYTRVHNPPGPNTWHLLKVELTKEQIQAIWNEPGKEIKVYIGNESTSTYAYFDELRFHPSDARMTTYSYIPMIGTSSVNNINNQRSSFTSDGLGREILIRDPDGNIIIQNEAQMGNPADFIWTPVEPVQHGTNLTFSPSCKTGNNYVVDFGDGTPQYSGNSLPFIHAYSQGNQAYNVTITVTINGTQFSKTKSVTVLQ